METIIKLLKKRKNFFAITFVACTIYVILFLILLLLSTPHPFLTFLAIVSVAPGCWLLVNILFKYRAKLENDINERLTKIIRQEFAKELQSQNIDCIFDVKATSFNSKNIANEFCFYYSGIKWYMSVFGSISRVSKWINGLLYDIHYIAILPEEDSTLQSDVVV